MRGLSPIERRVLVGMGEPASPCGPWCDHPEFCDDALLENSPSIVALIAAGRLRSWRCSVTGGWHFDVTPLGREALAAHDAATATQDSL